MTWFSLWDIFTIKVCTGFRRTPNRPTIPLPCHTRRNTVERCSPKLVRILVVTAGALVGNLGAGCSRPMGIEDHVASWSLEIANESGRRARVEISMGKQYFSMPSATTGKYGPTSGIIVLESGEGRTVGMTTGLGRRDSPEDNLHVCWLQPTDVL